MITDIPATVTDLVGAAASSVSRTLAVGEPLTVGQHLAVQHEELPLQHAVLAALGGGASGEIAVFVDDDLAAALHGSAYGELDLAAALAPTFDDLAASLGSVVIGVPQVVDGRLAVSRIGGYVQSGAASIYAGADVRAAVAVGLEPAAGARETRTAPGTPAAPSFERLDLLRGVEMAATVELGRARMTINDLLSLRNGAIIELDRPAGGPADLFVNGRLIARGEVVVVDENYALRITQIVSDDGGR